MRDNLANTISIRARPTSMRSWARRILLAATISMARNLLRIFNTGDFGGVLSFAY